MIPASLEDIIVPGTEPEVVSGYRSLAERAAEAVFGFEDEYCVLDVETTGYDPNRDRLIEVAAAVMRGPEVVDTFSALVDPLVPIPAEITKLTGIDDTMVAGAMCAEAAAAELARFAGGRALVAHHSAFDRSFLEQVAARGAFSDTWIDSLVLARIGLPRLRSHRLSDLAAVFAPDAADCSHRAGADVAALCRVFRVALVAISDIDPGVLSRIAELAPGAAWAERGILAHLVAASAKTTYDLKACRRARVATDRAEALEDAEQVDCVFPTAEEVRGHFSAGGLAGRMYDGFETRAEQLEMAEAVLSAFETSTHLAVEAGTGVGKSVAYLVPSALFAQRNRVAVGIATKTNALMDQLVYHELPKLSAALDDELRYVALKGYDHYLCLRKLERFASELGSDADHDTIGAVAMLLAWASQSAFGDLDSVNMHWWRELRMAIQSTQSDCNRKRCRYYPGLCFLHGVRRRALSANIVVTNHALLFRDVIAQGGILPPIRYWIVDEAHSAESEARKQLTEGASHSELCALLGTLHGKRGGLLSALRRRLSEDEDATPTLLVRKLTEEVSRAATLTDSLFDFVKDLAPLAADSDYDAAELWVNPGVRETGPWGVVESTGRSLAKRLEAILAHGRDLVTWLESAGPDFAEAKADLAGLVTRLWEQYAGLVAVIDGEDESLVYSASLNRRRTVDAEKLAAARLYVGEVLADDLYPRVRSVVFTSATIAAGASFDHFARGVGFNLLPDGSWESLRLASSYDFERQMTVFVATDIAEPNTTGYLGELESLLEGVHVAMGGSVLTLFTNRRDMERLHAVLEPRLKHRGLDLIVQRRGTSAKRLRDEFIADKSLSMFALKSFWEGFDAKGDTLRCVIVPKLPFGRPTDPLSRERECREGAVAWRRYVLPEAVLELKQAAGRLIRSSTDTGCLVLADARITTKRYGREFLDALPVDDVEALPAEKIAEQIAQRFGS